MGQCRHAWWPFVDSSFSFVFFRLFQASRAPALPCRSSESETIRNRPIPLRPWYPVTVHLNVLVALRGPSCVFVDHSFSFFGCFRQARPLPCRADHPWVKQGCFRQARPLPPTTGQIIRVGNKLCFKKNVSKSHGFNWFHGLRRPGRQGCFRQAGRKDGSHHGHLQDR